MRSFYIRLLILGCMHTMMMTGLDSWKGIASDITSFPLFQKSTWTGMIRSFGASPTGYVYSFSVYNDSLQPLYVSTQDLASIMGACIPKSGSWHLTTIPSHQHYSMHNKEYYFEMAIKSTPKEPSNHMPYQYQSDTLYLQDAITLEEPHSTKHHYFRSYIGTKFVGGIKQHQLMAEYLGYSDTAAGKSKSTSTGVSLSPALTSLTIKNSTNKDLFWGYVSQANGKILTPSSCQVFAKIDKNSFALYNSPSGVMLRPGTIGVFDGTTQALLVTYSLQELGFDDKPYTFEMYQDPKDSAVQVGMQGVMPGHYDVPVSRIRDISPIMCTLWRQGAQGQKGFIDLPGTLWVASVGLDEQIMIPVSTGQAVSWMIYRPALGAQAWLYFVYVASSDSVKAKAFMQRFQSGQVGADVVQTYHEQSKEQMYLAHKSENTHLVSAAGTVAATDPVAQSLLVQAAQGALNMHQCRMHDTTTGVDGYLLGADTFAPLGIGSTPMYYVLEPSWANSGTLPTMAVQNIYASTLSGTAPQGMPAPTMIVVAGAASMHAPVISKAKKAPVIVATPKATKIKTTKVKKVPASPALSQAVT